MNIHVGDAAPDFSAPDQNGNIQSLQQYRGKWIALYFYPKDDTPGCTKEACSFRDAMSELQDQVIVLGVSADDIESHERFAKKYHLHFPLIADPHKDIINAYGTHGALFPKRTTFLIDPEGKIAKIYEKVNVSTHAQTILRDVRSLGEKKRL